MGGPICRPHSRLPARHSPRREGTMSLGSFVIPDTASNTVGSGTGQHQELTPAQLIAKYGAGNVKTSSVNFAFPWQGSHIHFRKGVPVVITEPALLAALAAAGAPVS